MVYILISKTNRTIYSLKLRNINIIELLGMILMGFVVQMTRRL